MNKNDTLKVSEIFMSIQGEGPSTGRYAAFLRLFGCHLKCTFCDTAYTWKFDNSPHDFDQTIYDPKAESNRMSIYEVGVQLLSIGANLIVITGGEPLLQAKPLYNLILELEEYWDKFDIEVETSGTLTPAWLDCFNNVYFNVSPKLKNSGNSLEARYNKTHLKRFLYSNKAIFKFVVSRLSDFDEIEQIQKDIKIPNDMMWIMPMTNPTTDVLLEAVAELTVERKWNLSPRFHVDIWGNERGV